MVKISLIGSSIRPELWLALNENLSKNKVSYEIVFVGPFKPKFKLPKNIKHIEYFSKPSQCVEKGILNSVGDFIMIIADDVYFEDPHTLDKLYNCVVQNHNSLASCTYKIEGTIKIELLKYDPHIESSPSVPLAPLFSRNMIKKYGSVDSGFIAIMYDLDLYLRFLSNGAKLIYIEDAVLREDKNLSKGSTLNRDYWSKDRAYLDSLWVNVHKDGLISFNKERKYGVIQFNNYNIIQDICQSPKGRWGNRLQSKIVGTEFFNFFQSVFLFRIDYFYYLKNKYPGNPVIKFFYKIYKLIKS